MSQSNAPTSPKSRGTKRVRSSSSESSQSPKKMKLGAPPTDAPSIQAPTSVEPTSPAFSPQFIRRREMLWSCLLSNTSRIKITKSGNAEIALELPSNIHWLHRPESSVLFTRKCSEEIYDLISGWANAAEEKKKSDGVVITCVHSF